MAPQSIGMRQKYLSLEVMTQASRTIGRQQGASNRGKVVRELKGSRVVEIGLGGEMIERAQIEARLLQALDQGRCSVSCLI